MLCSALICVCKSELCCELLDIFPASYWSGRRRTAQTGRPCGMCSIFDIDTGLIRDMNCCPEVLFETCVAMKFVDDDGALNTAI